MNQGRSSSPAPVLDRGVGEEDFRDVRRFIELKERAAFAVKFLFVGGEREFRRREEHRSTDRHSEPLVERAPCGTRDMRPDGVEYPAIALVRIEAVVKELTQKTTVL